MRELLELLEHDARRPAGELAAMLHRSEYEVEQQMRQLEQERKKLNKTIAFGLDSEECLESSRRVDAILEQLLD